MTTTTERLSTKPYWLLGFWYFTSPISRAGTARFLNGYTNAVIGAVITLLTCEYPGSHFGTQYYTKLLASMVFAGTVFHLLIFGWWPDSASLALALVLSNMFFSMLSCGFPGPEASFSIDEFICMPCVAYFMLGVGVHARPNAGSAIHMGQHGITKNAQQWLLVLDTKTMTNAGFVPLVLFWIFGNQWLQVIWSVSLGLGAIPAIVAFFYEVSYWADSVEVHGHHSLGEVPKWLTLKWYWKNVLGLSFAWFIYDFIMYFGIYSSMITNNITGGNSSLSIVLGWSVVINLLCIPGTVLGTFLIDYLGLKTTMIIGLLLQAAIGFTMGIMYSQLTNHIATFAVMYGIFLSLGEVGPGSCLCILAAQSGLTAVNKQLSLIAVMIGKVGAFIGTWVFPQIIDSFGGSNTMKGNTGPFWIGSGLAILSAATILFLVKHFTDDGMKSEDKAFHV
ncbi:MFS Git1p-related glycerophosphoinositol and glycerophosphocholine permease [Pisolithus marmoratus]|nr:MFS Git1p-related glycerophosphoinositol and glycerophosphocholine permease [Pisolithus marmoratus]